MSPAPDSPLDDPQQVIADLQRQLAERTAERDEALQRETATAEVLGVINSSPGDLAPVFDAILEKAMRLCEAAFGMMALDEGEQARTVAALGVPDEFAEFRNRNPMRPNQAGIRDRLYSGESVVQIADMKDDDLYRSGDAHRCALVDLGGARTCLAVALRRDRDFLGGILIYRQEVRLFSDKQIALLQNFAAQAVIAMENARLISETQEALEQQTATAEVLQVINSSPGDLTPVFDAMLEKATTLCEAAYGTLFTYDGERFHAVALRGVPAVFADALNAPVQPEPGAALDRLVRGERYADCADVANEAAYRGSAGRALVELGGARSTLAVPLRKDDVLLGAFAIYRQEVRPFSDKQIALLRNFAAQAVIAMENARLITETREALEQQTATAEVLGVINSSPGDLAPVFDVILEKAHTLCDAATGSLRVIDGEMIRAVAFRGQSGEFADRVQQGYPFASAPLLAPLRDGAPFVHISDVAERDDSISRLSTASGNRTILAVPLRKDDALLGMIVAGRQEVRPFTDKQIALLQNFSAQAVIAMENARLINETREALEQQTATAEVLQVINSSPGDLAPVFDALLDKALRLCEASYGMLITWDGERLCRSAFRGASVELMEALGHEQSMPQPGGVADRLLHGENIIYAADITQDPSFARAPRVQTLARVGGARSYIAVPLRKDDRLLGFIGMYRREVRSFSEKEIALLQNFAAQAVIAMENARLITETREALEQQTATAEVLGVINSSPGDLAPVFDAILEKAHTLCGAEHGTLAVYDGEHFRVVALRAMPKLLADMIRQPFRPSAGGVQDGLLRGEPLVHIPDVTSREESATLTPIQQAAIDSGIRTLLLIPLRKDGRLLGFITAHRREVNPFSDKQIALLQNFAAQAVIAMENARLITETREALEQQTATAEVLHVINSSPGDLVPVFDIILEKAHSLCGIAFGSLQLYDGGKFRAVAVRGAADSLADLLRQPIDPVPGGLPTRLLGGEPFVQVADIAAFAEQQPDNPRARACAEHGLRTALYVPLRRDADFLGYITAFREEVRPFTDKQIALLQNFAAQAVIAMENARLITETREALEQQQAIAEVLGVINSSPGDLAPVFDAMLEKTLRLCEAAHGNFLTYDGEVFHRAAFRGEPQFAEYQRTQGLQRPAEVGQLARMVQGGGTLHRIDAREGEAYRDDPAFRRAVDGLGIRTSLTVPLRKGDALLGAVRAYRREVRPFTDKQIALVENFAAQAVIAMENARLLGELRQRTEEVGELNRDLEARVTEQVEELGRVGRLKRFLAPQLAELIVSQGDEKILESHRREIVVVFCDLRGYTAFTETAEPEEVLDFLRQYHGALGPLVSQFEGTLDQFSGDGIMVFFNDPVPCPDPAERAVNMAMAMREAARELIAAWSRHGCELGFGAGIAQGFATLGQIGFSERSGYTAIGTVCNLAARLCAEAKDGQILISSRIAEAVEAVARLEDLGNLELKGLRRPVAAFNVMQSTSPAEAHPNLTVVARGPGA